MQWIPVASSNLQAVAYDASARELWVEFKGNAVYVYSGVPESNFHALLAAGSKGSYLNDFIKPYYPYTRR